MYKKHLALVLTAAALVAGCATGGSSSGAAATRSSGEDGGRYPLMLSNNPVESMTLLRADSASPKCFSPSL